MVRAAAAANVAEAADEDGTSEAGLCVVVANSKAGISQVRVLSTVSVTVFVAGFAAGLSRLSYFPEAPAPPGLRQTHLLAGKLKDATVRVSKRMPSCSPSKFELLTSRRHVDDNADDFSAKQGVSCAVGAYWSKSREGNSLNAR